MVKGYDTTTSDPTKLLLDYLFSFSDSHKQSLSIQNASSLINDWLKNSPSTSSVYKQFQKYETKPAIVLHKYCSKPLFSNVPHSGDFNFPAYQSEEQVHICLNKVRNKIELKENLDRQLYAMYYNTQQQKSPSKTEDNNKSTVKDSNTITRQKQLIINLFQSCKQGYRNYGWDQQTTDRVSKKCAVYLFRRRSTSNLPPDSLFRYASKIAEQYCV